MAKELTKKESLELLRDWIIDRITDYGDYGEYNTLSEEERSKMEKAKEFMIGRVGRIDENAVHTANQKLDSRLTNPHY